MGSRQLIRTPKRMTKHTEWSPGPVKKSRFPLFKAHNPIGPAWRWRSAELKSDEHQFALLVQLRLDKPNYKAWLAVKTEMGWAMVARLESHSHSGLHCHMQCEGSLTVGEFDPGDHVAVPYWKSHHRRPHKVYSLEDAWQLALKFFRAQAAERGSLGI